MVLPRGCIEAATELFAACGARIEIEDRRPKPKSIRIAFSGELTFPQKAAVREMAEHEHGVLVAPPGSGKTVIACALIAKRKTPTLILVNRQTLLAQWLHCLQTFLGLSPKEIGQMRGSRKKLTKRIDIAMIQTLANRGNPRAFFRNYGAVIIDECHHVPAVTLEALLKECGCRFITGLTATPQRKDQLATLREGVGEVIESEESCLPIIEGSLSTRQRAAVITEFLAAIEEGRPACLFATRSLLGEGFDLPALDTLFLAMPISFKRRLIQYAGRLHRSAPGKRQVIIYDYLDEQLVLTASMYRKRLPAYRQMGYAIRRDEEGPDE